MLFALDRAGYRNIAGVDVSQEQTEVATRPGIASASCATLEDFLAAQLAQLPSTSFSPSTSLNTPPVREVMDVLASMRRVLSPGGFDA